MARSLVLHFALTSMTVALRQLTLVIIDIYCTNRLEKQKAAFESFDLSLESCEKCVHDLDKEQLQKFSAVGSTRNELNKQLGEIMVSGEHTRGYCTNVYHLI